MDSSHCPRLIYDRSRSDGAELSPIFGVCCLWISNKDTFNFDSVISGIFSFDTTFQYIRSFISCLTLSVSQEAWSTLVVPRSKSAGDWLSLGMLEKHYEKTHHVYVSCNLILTKILFRNWYTSQGIGIGSDSPACEHIAENQLIAMWGFSNIVQPSRRRLKISYSIWLRATTEIVICFPRSEYKYPRRV